jgi:hypothetical protein
MLSARSIAIIVLFAILLPGAYFLGKVTTQICPADSVPTGFNANKKVLGTVFRKLRPGYVAQVCAKDCSFTIQILTEKAGVVPSPTTKCPSSSTDFDHCLDVVADQVNVDSTFDNSPKEVGSDSTRQIAVEIQWKP